MNETNRLVNPIWVKVVTEDTSLFPKYQTAGSAGCDLHSAEDVNIEPNSRGFVNTGIKIEIPEGYGAFVCPRSGLAVKNGITVLNSPGIIDNDYRGEIKVILFNTSDKIFTVKKGDRIAQLVFFPIIQAIFRKVAEVSDTTRGEGGFGSTGIST